MELCFTIHGFVVGFNGFSRQSYVLRQTATSSTNAPFPAAAATALAEQLQYRLRLEQTDWITVTEWSTFDTVLAVLYSSSVGWSQTSWRLVVRHGAAVPTMLRVTGN